MTVVDTERALALHASGAQFVEVLPHDAFAREHIPGARSLPLPTLTPESASVLDHHAPVVTYCYDHECDLSSRAGALLESYGFEEVYDYAASKTAWIGAGLPVDGSVRVDERAAAIADRDVPTCRSDELVETLADRMHECLGLSVVLGDDAVVLGVVDRRAVEVGGVRVGSIMQTGARSVRPGVLRHELAASMDRGGERYVLVTTSHGRLIGLITRDRLDRV